ncbi:MAG: DUF3842 family protein [Sphaerochaeta sp.]|uniref:DUF3842 family protein n=1 Tax=Sphaerochaeta sp. TaxID=1972642 RepID=UPI002A365EC4|nr:DUF3842 family protein [Sphaerochaeta sp.]MDX9824647.1 DUF3842 family protein [Sphaerochaeta sp.]
MTPTMAVAVAQSKAHKILLPISKCNVSVVGRQDLNLTEMIDLALSEIATFLDNQRQG